MFWISLILFLIFLTPLGWIGMVCLGALVAFITDAIKDPDDIRSENREQIYNAMIARIERGDFKTVEEVKDFFNERLHR